MKKYSILFFILSSILMNNMMAQSSADPAAALPDSLNEWKRLSDDRFYNDQNLYEYIDGAAELYISFGFSIVFSRIYSNESGSEITLDIFYMNSSQDAYGAFSYSVGKIENEFGMQSQETSGSLLFWKDRFYISIVGNSETEESKKIILELGRLIDNAIPEKGKFPGLLELLPSAGLNKESIRYFRHYIWLNSYTFISAENILNINQNTECIQAKYGEKDKSILMIIQYPDRESLLNAKSNFIEKFNPGLKKKGFAKISGKWSGISELKNALILVLNAVSKSNAVKLIDLAEENINRVTSINK